MSAVALGRELRVDPRLHVALAVDDSPAQAGRLRARVAAVSIVGDTEVGDNVRRLRLAAGLSQAGLAEALASRGYGLSQQTLVKIEKGTRPLKLLEANALAEVLEATITALLAYDMSEEEVQAFALDRRLFDSYLSLGRQLLAFRQARRELGDHLATSGLSADETERAVDRRNNRLLDVPEPEVIEAMLDVEKAHALGLLAQQLNRYGEMWFVPEPDSQLEDG